MEYKGMLPARKPWLTPAILVLAGVLTVQCILLEQWLYIILLLLVALACFYQKQPTVSDEGVDSRGVLFGHVMHNLWTWDQIEYIQFDRAKARPHVLLYISKDVMARTLMFTPADAEKVVELALRQNPAIQVEDPSREDQEEKYRAVRREKETLRARNAAEKRRKKR